MRPEDINGLRMGLQKMSIALELGLHIVNAEYINSFTLRDAEDLNASTLYPMCINSHFQYPIM